MNRIIVRAALAASGAILGLIGFALMFTPQAFLKSSHVIVAPDPGLMSELSAPSGVLLITGSLMVFAAVKLRFAKLGLISGAIVYGSYGVGRLVSVAVHGTPPQSLLTAMLIELGVAAVLVTLHRRHAHHL